MGKQTVSTVLWETKVETSTSKPLAGIIQLLALAVCLLGPGSVWCCSSISSVKPWDGCMCLSLGPFSLWIRRSSAMPCSHGQVGLPVIFASDPFRGEMSSANDMFAEKEKQFFVVIVNNSLT